MNRVCLFATIAFLFACRTEKTVEDPAAWKKIKIDFKQLDADGLLGPAQGKVAMNYEFCIPQEPRYWKQVRRIDTSARKNEGKGRIGCKADQWLIIGATNQKNYQHILFQLASLPYVDRIEQTFWE